MAADSLDALYAAPPARFVEERKRLARELRAAGRREEAKAVDKLTRPTVSVWATNQLAREQASRVAELLELTDRLRDTQGRGDAGAFAGAASAHRAVLGVLRDDAERLLVGAGHAPSPQLLGRVVGNLRAGAADPELRPRIAAGRLEHDVEETGFGGLLETGFPAPAPSARPAAKPAGTARPVDDAAARKADAQARRAEEAAARATERARSAERARAEREAEKLRSRLDAARREVDREARAVNEARQTLEASEGRLAAARTGEQRLAVAVAAAEAELVRLRG